MRPLYTRIRAVCGRSSSWKLRYPVGPDARGMLTLRKLASDEDWIDRYAELDDDAWAEIIKREFLGLDIRPYLAKAAAEETPAG